VVAFLATFAWLLTTDIKASPAVLWPSVLAVGLAFVTRDIYLSLFLGALLIRAGNPWSAFQDLFAGGQIPSLTDRWNISVLIFTLLMGGFVEVLNHGHRHAAGHSPRGKAHFFPCWHDREPGARGNGGRRAGRRRLRRPLLPNQ
jgi:general stress protein CsbA